MGTRGLLIGAACVLALAACRGGDNEGSGEESTVEQALPNSAADVSTSFAPGTSESAIATPTVADTSPSATSCRAASPDVVTALADGLTGGGNPEDAWVVDDPRAQYWEVIVAARITGQGNDDLVGTWGIGAEAGVLTFALNTAARESSTWGMDVADDSGIGIARNAAAASEPAAQAEACVRAQ